jgi:hypothetical protein
MKTVSTAWDYADVELSRGQRKGPSVLILQPDVPNAAVVTAGEVRQTSRP